MNRDGVTRREAAEEWVHGFNTFPTSMIEKLMRAEPDAWHEITKPAVGDRVYIFNRRGDDQGEIVKANYGKGRYKIKLDGGEVVWQDADDFEVSYDGWLPMWGTMWQFGDSCDDYWLEELDGFALMSGCGFRIFESDEYGYFFGIDGAGYDFYEQHWLPLYKERGLKWHDPATEKAGAAS